ncbi:hypothetical protein [Winogradskyella sp. PC D3.3]
MRSILAIVLFWSVALGYSQAAPSFNSVGLKITIDASITNDNFKLDLTEFLNNKHIGLLHPNLKTSNLLLAFDGSNYTLTRLPEMQTIYKIDNSKPNKTLALIKDKIQQYAYGYRIKNLRLKNPLYAFQFKIKPITYKNGKVVNAPVLQHLSKSDGIINFNANESVAILEVTNLSDLPIYFSIIEINSRGEIQSFIPNVNCALLGSERRLEPHQTISVESCLFNFGPPYETLTLKGFASAEPINFDPIIQNEDNSSLEYVKANYTEMYTYDFAYNILDKNGNMPYNVAIDAYKPKTSSELEAAVLEIETIKKGKLTSEYLIKLNEISSLHHDLGNIDEAMAYSKKAATLKLKLQRHKESSSKISTADSRKKRQKKPCVLLK